MRKSRGPETSDFINTFCRVTKDSVGGRAGDLVVLRGWQNELLRHVFAERSDGRLQYRQALIGVARKNGKSAMGAGIALDHLLFSDPGSEVYSCAGDREQARIVFGTAKRMVELEPELGCRLKLYRDAIEHTEAGSVYKVLSAEAYSKEGLNPTLVLFDEVHVQPNRELWDVMAQAMGARVEPLMIGITTAGVRFDTSGQDSLCYSMYQYGKRIVSGEVDDPSFFFAWWEPKSPAADHRDPSTWREASPGLGDIVSEEDYATMVLKTPEAEFRALDVDTPILTTAGWVKMADLSPGDEVFAQDGSPTRVIGASEVFTGRECFLVTGSDGRALVADAEHWWPVETYDPGSNKRESQWVTTQWIADNPTVIKYLLPGAAVDSPEVSLPVNPYVFGLWLGDGTAVAPVLTAHCDDVPHIVAELDRAGYFHTMRKDTTATRIYVSTRPVKRGGRGQDDDTLRRRLQDMGVLGAKHIPEEYLLGSKRQRLALLQGLMDTDGTVGAGRARFTNKDRGIADAVLYLARSLGWKATLQVKANAYGNFYNVAWTAYGDDEKLPFRMRRKVERLNKAPKIRTRATRIKIDAIRLESRPTRCIAVAHPSRTFLAGSGLMPTGNTKRCNQFVAAGTAWLPAGAWDVCESTQGIPDGAEVCLGFDGSFNNDSTALVVVSCGEVPHVDVVECWEKPAEAGQDWAVPIAAVEDAIRAACKRWQVREIVCDPFRWARTYQVLEDEGLPVVEYPQSPSRMTPATQRFYEAVMNKGLTHSGDPRLARHVGNAVLKQDSRGARIVKEARNSARKIDLAVAAVMAFDRAATPAETVDVWSFYS